MHACTTSRDFSGENSRSSSVIEVHLQTGRYSAGIAGIVPGEELYDGPDAIIFASFANASSTPCPVFAEVKRYGA